MVYRDQSLSFRYVVKRLEVHEVGTSIGNREGCGVLLRRSYGRGRARNHLINHNTSGSKFRMEKTTFHATTPHRS